MKIAEINQVDYGSTGGIMLQIAEKAREEGSIARTYSKKWKKQTAKTEDHFFYGYTLENAAHVVLAKTFGYQEMYSHAGTRQLVKMLENFSPDIVHLHNLHDYCFHLPTLFNYIHCSNTPVVWTLHDCWAFTGQCPYFAMVKCGRWKEGCHDCPQVDNKLHIDCSRYMWAKKKELFTSIENMTIVTPSNWLAGLAKQSFLKDYDIMVIHNGIDLGIFKSTSSDFREEYGVEDRYLVLGVAMGWGKRKGLDVMVEIAKRLDDRFRLVMVGTTEATDKILPEQVISIHRTDSQAQLAEIYSAADVFINPTREENFPTVNIESLACGTPVITFDTGGSPEILDGSCGMVVDCDDVDALEQSIRKVCEEKLFSEEDCIRRAKMFDKKEKYQEYIELYHSVCKLGGGIQLTAKYSECQVYLVEQTNLDEQVCLIYLPVCISLFACHRYIFTQNSQRACGV